MQSKKRNEYNRMALKEKQKKKDTENNKRIRNKVVWHNEIYNQKRFAPMEKILNKTDWHIEMDTRIENREETKTASIHTTAKKKDEK